ncbi:MAG: HAD family hydrolase [Deltaproteobacteria bacterium]|nr:HAD family hydrolase [Deltaproteobacteria bacterium]
MNHKLLALDLDGTLLRRDGSVAPEDIDAIQSARRRGVLVTLCTGRITTGTLPTAKLLSLDTTLICADGGLLACPRTGRTLEQTGISDAAAHRATLVTHELGLAPFVFLPGEIHADVRGTPWLHYVRTWTPNVHVYDDLHRSERWKQSDPVAIVLAIGPQSAIQQARDQLTREHPEAIQTDAWRAGSSGDQHVLMIRPYGVDKGVGLAKLAQSLNIAREDVCAVGDWLNDVPMFKFAGRSFVMGQSLELVRASATDLLEAPAGSGGGVAEAITRWLGE